MNVDSILISDYAATVGGKLVVVGVFNRIPTNEAPATLAHMSISIVIHGHSAEAGTKHELQIKLLNSRREVLTDQIRGEFTFPPADQIIPGLPLRHVWLTSMLMPSFPEIGPYAFEVYIDETYHASSSFYVGPGS